MKLSMSVSEFRTYDEIYEVHVWQQNCAFYTLINRKIQQIVEQRFETQPVTHLRGVMRTLLTRSTRSRPLRDHTIRDVGRPRYDLHLSSRFCPAWYRSSSLLDINRTVGKRPTTNTPRMYVDNTTMRHS